MGQPVPHPGGRGGAHPARRRHRSVRVVALRAQAGDGGRPERFHAAALARPPGGGALLHRVSRRGGRGAPPGRGPGRAGLPRDQDPQPRDARRPGRSAARSGLARLRAPSHAGGDPLRPGARLGRLRRGRARPVGRRAATARAREAPRGDLHRAPPGSRRAGGVRVAARRVRQLVPRHHHGHRRLLSSPTGSGSAAAQARPDPVRHRFPQSAVRVGPRAPRDPPAGPSRRGRGAAPLRKRGPLVRYSGEDLQ